MKYIIFGLGAIGSNLVSQLIHLDNESGFYGVDFDNVEQRNIPTQSYFQNHIGIPKPLAMSIIIGLKKQKPFFTPVVKRITNYDDPVITEFANNDDYLLVDCFDNTQSRRYLEGIDNCLHIGFSPKYTAEIIWGKKYTAPDDIKSEENDICEMVGAVPFIHYVVSLASINIMNYINSGEQNSYIIQRIGKFVKL